MKRTGLNRRISGIAAIFAATMLAAPALQAQGNKPPDAGGGGKGEEAATHNLSFPGMDVGGAPVSAYFNVAAPGTLGVTYSYGCKKEDSTSVEGRTFANTSCVSSDGNTFYTPAQCTATGAPCEGFSSTEDGDGGLSRIYWQKVSSNDWSADSVIAPGGALTAQRADWADNLESRSWTSSSIVRVETTPYVAVTSLKGLQMWHVFGQGTNEMWGVRTTHGAVPYVYLSGYAIVRTTAQLNIEKMTRGPSDLCPTSYQAPPYDPSWDSASKRWSGSYLLHQLAFTPELNIGGKYVYGYNWALRRDAVPAEVGKGGWWRLTYFVPGLIDFVHSDIPVDYFTPPAAEDGTPTTLPTAVVAAESETGDSLYKPMTKLVGGLTVTYLDICINETKGGGKAGGKGSGKGNNK